MTSRTRRVSPSTDADPSRPPGTAPCFVAFHRMSRHEDRPIRRFCLNPSSVLQCHRARMLGHRFSNRSIEAVGPRRARSIAELSAAGAQACRFGAPQRHRRGRLRETSDLRPLVGVDVPKKHSSTLHDKRFRMGKSSAVAGLVLDIFFTAKILLAVLRNPSHRIDRVRPRRLQNQDVSELRWNARGHRRCPR
jgi:hypothetical protein